MTFTRTSDSATLDPLFVFGPYENEREVRTAVVPLAESSNVRVTYNYVGLRTGTFMMLFDSYAAATAGATFFSSRSSYSFDSTDDTFDMLFVVFGGGLRVVQNAPKWELHVPYHELVEGT
jgi:hypothetical protein